MPLLRLALAVPVVLAVLLGMAPAPRASMPRPQVTGTSESAGHLASAQTSGDFGSLESRTGFACDRDGCRPAEVPGSAPAGLFRSGHIDLTGDGTPESVERVDEQIRIAEGSRIVWRGEPGWRVLDLALGDPNDDGRVEALLALRKAGADRVEHSHPFMVGYRSGSYRVIWGGSAVARPILQVELGDLDGDRVEELVVLEEEPSAPACGDGGRRTEDGGDAADRRPPPVARLLFEWFPLALVRDCMAEHRVAVWRWHGWGFSLVWRSPPGR
ncbi:MAG TPA: hypothetical protein VER55_06280, partial [Ardenticatenaceae bacterium]|nr:hypothetical protein [Ardenticatenaceae bacterium]